MPRLAPADQTGLRIPFRRARPFDRYLRRYSVCAAIGEGQLNLEGTVSVSGLGATPYRDGSYEYCLSEKVVTNDPKGIGALLLAATEMETGLQSTEKNRSGNIRK